jgi:hypothetical protein
MSQKYEFDELDQAVREWAVMSQWEKDQEWYENLQKQSWPAQIFDTDDGSGDGILQFPDELIRLKGWKEGTVLNMMVEEGPTGNILIITEKN